MKTKVWSASRANKGGERVERSWKNVSRGEEGILATISIGRPSAEQGRVDGVLCSRTNGSSVAVVVSVRQAIGADAGFDLQ